MNGMESYPQALQEGEKKKQRIAIIDNSDKVESSARDAADASLTRSKEEFSGVKGFLKKIWTHNIAKPYYRQKEMAKAKAEIIENNNVFVREGGEKEHQDRLDKTTTEKFLSDNYEKTVHCAAGETREILGEGEAEQKIRSGIKSLMMDYASGKITEEAFPEETNRIFNELKGVKKDVMGKGLMYANNILEIAKQVKQAVEHGERLEELDLDFEIVIGKAKLGARTEAQYDAVDKITAKIMDSKVGSFVNEATVASALAITYSVGAAISKSFANSKLASWGSFGLTALMGGGVAAARERKMLEDDRSQHAREMAQGKNFKDVRAPRRKEMEQYRYETRDSNSLFQDLDQSLYFYDKEGKRELKQNLTAEEFQIALGQLAEADARTKLSDNRKIDLITYSDDKTLDQERLLLDNARATAKKDLEKHAYSKSSKEVLAGKSLDEFLSSLTEARMKQLVEGDKGIEKQNECFRSFKNKEAGKAFVKGVVTGLVVGAAAQELMAFMRPGQTGLVENFLTRDANGAVDTNGIPIPEHYTPLEYARRWAMEHFTAGEFPRMDMQNAHETIIGAMHIKLPEGTDVIPNADGSYSLTRGSDILYDNITLDDQGNISEQARHILHEQGINIKSTPGIGTPHDYIEHNPESTTAVHRKLWYDNDTPAPIFDKNELKLWWGGHQGTGIDANGNYVFNMKHMTPDGSYHDNFSVDAQEAMESGKLKMIFSLSKDTQNHVFQFDIDAHGNAIIDPNSEAGKMLFENVDGHAKFLGKYAEVAQNMGTASDGAENVRILATHVGEGVDQVAAPIAIFDVPAPYDVDAPWIFPAVGRTPLEKTSQVHPYLDGYFKEDKRNAHFYKERRSASLENPNVKLDCNKEIGQYLDKQNDQWKKKLSEMDGQINIPMEKECRMAICIPAAGHQEGKNIFHTLEQYKNQKNADGKLIDPNLFEILVFVNHPVDSQPDETLSEVKRFQMENPKMAVNVVYEKLDRKDAKIGNIRKYVTDLALLRHNNRADKNNDLIIASNDADCKGMSEYYVSNFLDEFKKHENVDALLGKIDWENEAYSKSPLLHMGTRFFQYLDAAHRHHKNKIEKGVGSSGANFAFKASIYAAVGGYVEHDSIAEDRHLGTMIKGARRGAAVYPIEYAGAKSYIHTSARRAVNALKKGLSPAEQWGTDFGPDDELRKIDWNIDDSEKDLESKEYQDKLRTGLERFINRTLKVYNLEPESWAAKKAMRFMGVKYVIEKRAGKSEVVLTDMSKLIKGLKEYKK